MSIAFFAPDQSLKLGEYISTLKKDPSFYTNAEKLYEQKKYDDMLILYAQSSDTLMHLSDKDMESVLNLLVALVKDAQVQVVESVVKSLIESIQNTATDKTVTKLRILSNLFNSLDRKNPMILQVYYAIITVAAKGDELDLVLPTFVHLKQWIQEWGLTIEKQRQVYLFISDALSTYDPIQSYEYLLKYLKTFEQATPDALKSTQSYAVKAIQLAISLPLVLNFEQVYNLTAIQALKSDKLLDLLKIFVSGTLPQYMEFNKKNPEVVKKNGLKEEDNVRKMRLLSLASLAAAHVDGNVEYSLIATTLNIPQDQVEIWVIDAIRSGLLDAKMDQLSQSMLVSRCAHRVFGTQEWKKLGEKLTSWKSSLNDMLKVIDNARELVQQSDTTLVEKNLASISVGK